MVCPRLFCHIASLFNALRWNWKTQWSRIFNLYADGGVSLCTMTATSLESKLVLWSFKEGNGGTKVMFSRGLLLCHRLPLDRISLGRVVPRR